MADMIHELPRGAIIVVYGDQSCGDEAGERARPDTADRASLGWSAGQCHTQDGLA